VRVRHVEKMDYSKAFHTPAWGVTSGFGSANPRDPFLVIGTEIIETPMADRWYFEAWAYRQLFKEYFRAGAKWTAAPKPMLTDELFKTVEEMIVDGNKLALCQPSLSQCSMRQISCVAARHFRAIEQCHQSIGVEWLQRHIGDGYRIHLVKNNSPEAIHIDTTFMPIAEGKIIYNPELDQSE
jgi:glycine amidinotransferase